MKWSVCVVLLLSLLVGCRGGSGSAASAATTPEQVHQAWVAAMQHNDRAAALTLAAEMDAQSAFVDDNLRALQDRLHAAKDGALQSVAVRAPTAEGAGMLGVSVWTFAQYTACYRTVLHAAAGGWKVASWGVMYQCPAGVK